MNGEFIHPGDPGIVKHPPGYIFYSAPSTVDAYITYFNAHIACINSFYIKEIDSRMQYKKNRCNGFNNTGGFKPAIFIEVTFFF